MKRHSIRSRLARWCALVIILLLTTAAPPAGANPLVDFFESVIDNLIHNPVPEAIAPIVTLAENSDTIAVAGLETYLALRTRNIEIEYSQAGETRQHELDHLLKAIAELKLKVDHIKNERYAAEKKAEEDSCDPVFVRLGAGRPITGPGRYTFTLLDDGWFDLPGDIPPGSISAVMTPQANDYADHYVPVLAATVSLDITATGNPNVFNLGLLGFSYELDSYELLPGVMTGLNHGSLNPFGSPAVGQFDVPTGRVTGRMEGMFINDVNDATRPQLFFLELSGTLVPATGALTVSGTDPMITPLPAPLLPADCPRLMGAHVPAYDAAAGVLRLLENTTLIPGADVAMVRYGDKTYAHDPAADRAIGARLVVEPMPFTGETPDSVFTFADAGIQVVKDATTLLEGVLTEIRLDSRTGSFFADLDVTSSSGTSPAVEQIAAAAAGSSALQIAAGPGAWDLVVATAGFSVSARLPWPELFHLGVFATTTAVGDESAAMPASSRVTCAFPNPFNPVMKIRLELRAESRLTLAVYSVEGRRVASLVDGTLSAGVHEVTWRGLDDGGRSLPSGVYTYRLETAADVQTGKLTLVR